METTKNRNEKWDGIIFLWYTYDRKKKKKKKKKKAEMGSWVVLWLCEESGFAGSDTNIVGYGGIGYRDYDYDHFHFICICEVVGSTEYFIIYN